MKSFSSFNPQPASNSTVLKHAFNEQLEDFSMVEMGKKIKFLAPHLWDLLDVLLDADPTCRRAAPKAGKSQVDEDAEMDLGEIGGEGSQCRDRQVDWADLDIDQMESDISDDDGNTEQSPQSMLNLPRTIFDSQEVPSSSGSESNATDKITASKPHKPTWRHHKQNPAKQNAVLLAIVSPNISVTSLI